jgi:hypothetical protein
VTAADIEIATANAKAVRIKISIASFWEANRPRLRSCAIHRDFDLLSQRERAKAAADVAKILKKNCGGSAAYPLSAKVAKKPTAKYS